jgi:hypothetical protein
MIPLAIFLHIPKTAGSSLSSCFNLNFDARERLYMDAGLMGLPPHAPQRAVRWDDDLIRQTVCRAPENTRYIYGHLAFFGIHRWLKPPREARYFTFLRDPVERVVSLYRFVKSRPAHDWNAEITSNDWSLEQWAAGSAWLERNDGQTRRLLLGCEDTSIHDAALSSHRLERAHLEIAKARLREFWFVGLTETFDDDAHYLYGHFGFYRFAPDLVVNASPKSDAVSDYARRLIAQENLLDAELYQYARELHAEYVQRNRMIYHYHRAMALKRRALHRWWRRFKTKIPASGRA